jgi:hypothetical protein
MLYDVRKYGYLPCYGPDSPHQFTKKFSKKVSVSFDVVDYDPASDFKVLVQCEPPVLYNAFEDIVKQNYQNFDLVLAYHENLLGLPNAREFLPVSSWVKHIDVNKTNQISFLTSSKMWTADHAMRFMILRRVENLTRLGRFDFLMHRSPPRVESKEKFYENAKFNIACENQVMPNMFTEKLIDCFQTRTIPIYWGASNIGDTFNKHGIIAVNNLQEIINVCNQLTPDTYEKMLPLIEDNYEISCKYCVYDKQLENTIKQILDE